MTPRDPSGEVGPLSHGHIVHISGNTDKCLLSHGHIVHINGNTDKCLLYGETVPMEEGAHVDPGPEELDPKIHTPRFQF